jgi:hypothetical protein
MQHMQPSPARNPYSMPLPPAGSGLGAAGIVGSGMSGMEMPPSYIQPRPGRLPKDRPIVKLSVSLIDTYKEINRVSLWTVLMTAFVSVDFGLVWVLIMSVFDVRSVPCWCLCQTNELLWFW